MIKENTKEVLAIILARGGSKGIPGKNIKKIRGKPLIAYSIEAAQKAKYITRIVLSTDDEAIARVAEDYGAEVPFLRPPELATDKAKSNDAIIHALKWLNDNEGYQPDYIVLLQPTSPLRRGEDIDKAMRKLIQVDADSLVSICEVDKSPYWMRIIDGEGYLQPFIKSDKEYSSRQDLPDIYVLNGAIYIAKRDIFLQNGGFMSDKTLPYIMPRERSVDIDDMLDWKLTELLLEVAEND